MRIPSKIAALCGIAILATTWTSAASAAETIKLGVIMPVSGGAAFVGNAVVDGIKLAVDEINAAGGIGGKKLEYVVRDSQAKPDVSVAAAKELITSEKVDVLVGPATSGAALAVSEVAKAEKIVNLSPTANASSLTDEKLHKYIFQFASTSDADAPRMIAVLQKLGAKKLCFAGYDYAGWLDVYKAIKANLPADIEETNHYLVKLGNTDYSTLISQLMADPCDTIMGYIWGGGFIAFAKQAGPFGLFNSKKMLAGGNVGDYSTLSALKETFPEGVWAYAQDLWYYNDIPELAAYHEALAKLQGREDTGMFAICGYVAVKALAAGIEKAGSADADKLAEALEGLTVATPLGELTMDAKKHRFSLPAFYGPITTHEGSDIKRMNPVELIS